MAGGTDIIQPSHPVQSFAAKSDTGKMDYTSIFGGESDKLSVILLVMSVLRDITKVPRTNGLID
jgi:hypothetical protein